MDPFDSLDAGATDTDFTSRAAARNLVVYLCWIIGASATFNAMAFTLWLCNMLLEAS